MQKPQMSEDLFSMSESLPKLESTSKNNSRVFYSLEKTSLRNQQLVIATIAGLISSIVVVAVIQLVLSRGGQPGITTLPQLTEIALAAFVTVVTVGAITFALEVVIVNQINRGIGNLQEQCDQVASGDFNAQATVYVPKELEQLAMSFNHMTQVIHNQIAEAKQKADEQEKAKEDLQQQLVQLIQGMEETFGSDLTLHPEEAVDEEHEQTFIPPEGTLLEFLDKLLNVNSSQQSISPEILFGSSRIEEIQRYRDDIQYREAWLQALLKEAQKQLKFVTFIMQRADLKKEQAISELQKEMNSL